MPSLHWDWTVGNDPKGRAGTGESGVGKLTALCKAQQSLLVTAIQYVVEGLSRLVPKRCFCMCEEETGTHVGEMCLIVLWKLVHV